MAKKIDFKRIDKKIRKIIEDERVPDRFVDDVYQDAWVAFLEGKDIKEAIVHSNKAEKFHYVVRI